MFSDTYQDLFATVGIRPGKDDRCKAADIEKAEKRLGTKIPVCLKDYYLLCGREKRINQFHNRLLPPDKWFVDSNTLVFMEENQWVVFWGTSANSELKDDAAVFQGANYHEKGIQWYPE